MYRPSNFLLLLSLVIVLNVIGLVMVLSSSSVDAIREYGSAWVFFDHQLMWLAIGGAVFLLTARTDYRRWQRASGPLLVVTLFLLLAVLVPKIGVQVAGSSRWIGAGQFRLQPSELMKMAMVLFAAHVLARRVEKYGWRDTIRPVVVVFVMAGALIMMQPDMGTTMILACISLGTLFAVGTPRRTVALLVGALVASGFILGFAQPYRRARLLSFMHPFAHASGSGYQVVQSLVGLGRGHLLGVGLGASRAKWGFLPNAHTDFIFSIIGEELGIIGSLLVVCLFVALAFLGMRVAARAPDRFGALLSVGITCWIIGQAIINIGATVGLLPVTGVP
ncbi:MAG: putative lipid II flippase FtsW, partial [Acidimicrobiales bacterium]